MKSVKLVLSEHAQLRMEQREISFGQILKAVNFPDKRIKTFGNRTRFLKTIDQRVLEVIVVPLGKRRMVVTVFWTFEGDVNEYHI